MNTVSRCAALIVVTGALAIGCDSAPLVAPVASTIEIAAAATAVPPDGSVEVAAFVIEEAGTPVQDGTVVTFTATLGVVEPAEAPTEDGIARTTFFAGSTPGTARVTARSGAAEPAGSEGNEIEITIGAAN